MFNLWEFPSILEGPEMIGLIVVAVIIVALAMDIRTRAHYLKTVRKEWHDIDPRPAESRHKHPVRIVRFDEPALPRESLRPRRK